MINKTYIILNGGGGVNLNILPSLVHKNTKYKPNSLNPHLVQLFSINKSRAINYFIIYHFRLGLRALVLVVPNC